MKMSALLLAVPLACACFTAAGEEPAPAPTAAPARPDCKGVLNRQFDFWVGDWTVTVGGKPAGENRIEKILNGCALLENWSGVGGLQGNSVNFYDSRRGVWHQTWIDSTGGALQLDGKFADGRMTMTGAQTDPKTGRVATQRITWTPLPAGVRQVWESSEDGKEWTVLFDGIYKRKAPG